MSYPLRKDLPKYIKGDGWEGLQLGPIKVGESVDDVAVPETALTLVEVVFWKSDTEQVRYSSADEGSGMTITDADGWVAELTVLDEQLAAGKYNWAARFSAEGWGPRTLFEGGFEVVQVIPDPIT